MAILANILSIFMVGGFLGLKISAKQVNSVKVSKNEATQRVITLLGKKLLTIFIGDYDYEGEIDEQGKACGYGIAVSIKEPDSRWEGTF